MGLFIGMARLLDLLGNLRISFYARKPERWRPYQILSPFGSTANVREMLAGSEDVEQQHGMEAVGS